MRFLNSEKAESPIEILFVIMLFIMTMTLTVLVFGNFVDEFLYTWGTILADNPMGSWGNGMYANIVTRFSDWFWIVPGFFVMVIILWGIKTVIKKHEYTTAAQDQQFMSDEF